MNTTLNLTEHFTLASLLKSETATANGFTEQFNPSDEIVLNLKNLCINVLEPLRAAYSKHCGKDMPLYVTSAYRCPRVNGDVPGHASNSQHIQGMAADTHVDGMSVEEWYQFIKNSGIAFDQLIQEHNLWAHVSFSNHPVQRGDCLRATGTIPAPIYTSDGMGSFKKVA